MRTNDLHQTNTNHPKYFLKMTKTRAVTVLLMIISTCGVILSLTDAYPTTNVADAENLTGINHPDTKNSTRLVITHLVKTIEFEVGVMEDDGIDGVEGGGGGVDGADADNGTGLTTTQYIETDIKLLNVDLLREILDKMDEENSSSTTEKAEEEERGKEELPSPPSTEGEMIEN